MAESFHDWFWGGAGLTIARDCEEACKKTWEARDPEIEALEKDQTKGREEDGNIIVGLENELARALELHDSARTQADSQLQARLAEERAHALTKSVLETTRGDLESAKDRLAVFWRDGDKRKFLPGQHVSKAVGIYYGLEVVGYTPRGQVVTWCWRGKVETFEEDDLTTEPREEWT